ncbi:uncharacterized protein LOC128779026 isoform X1 [Panthera pardus]|uniref:Uncharacterized protein LOC128779026 isoform X1 n=1 Tax=Panthera pardus TaxID=9691 RepID=A0A9W2W4V2_PANPR|nr:uncharacterized protein LOC128779026 isoform X1 [Panthera pardus]
MRLSVRAPRRARPELFVNYISRAFIAPEPRATQKPPPPPQTASLAPGAPASRRSGCDGSAGPEVSGSPTRDLAPEKGGVSPAGEGRGRYAGQDRILRATLLLSLFQSLRNSGPQCYDKAARKVRNVNWGAEGQEHRIPSMGSCFRGSLVFGHIMSKWTGHSTITCYITSYTHRSQTSFSCGPIRRLCFQPHWLNTQQNSPSRHSWGFRGHVVLPTHFVV